MIPPYVNTVFKIFVQLLNFVELAHKGLKQNRPCGRLLILFSLIYYSQNWTINQNNRNQFLKKLCLFQCLIQCLFRTQSFLFVRKHQSGDVTNQTPAATTKFPCKNFGWGFDGTQMLYCKTFAETFRKIVNNRSNKKQNFLWYGFSKSWAESYITNV